MPSGCGAASGIPPGSRCARATSASRSSARCATMTPRPGCSPVSAGRAPAPRSAAICRAASSPTTQRGRSCSGSTEPDGDLLTKLALPFAAVLPPSVGFAAPAKRGLPATGPYMITEIEPSRFVRLERNPRFKSWSACGAPRRLPRRHHGAPRRQWQIRRGPRSRRATRIASTRCTRLPAAAPQAAAPRAGAAARHRSIPATFYPVLNTRRAPFHRLDARRAVAYVFDRRVVVTAAGGHDVAQENCQILPPNFPGSRPYCPYTTRDRRSERPSQPHEGAPVGAAFRNQRDACDRPRWTSSGRPVSRSR